MYILKAESGQQAFYVIDQNKEFTIGRKGCDFLIENDTSVSKRHATITLKGDVLQIQDIGSKFSTFINSLKIEKHKTVILNEDDTVRFGMLNSHYKIIKKSLVVLCSGLTSPNKNKLKQMLQSMNGKLVNQWDKNLCYLIVDKIVLTSKVIQAIIEGLPIVSLDYFEELQNCVKNNQIPPDKKKFLPKPSNVMLKNLNFDYNPKRKSLFKNKVFVFKNKSNLDEIISCCGGKSIIYNDNNQENITKETLEGYNPQYIVISDEIFDPNSKHSFDKLVCLLNELKKRAIPQQEIPLAIMKCCIETNCNPDFDRVGNLLKGNEINTPPKPPLVGETEQKYTEIDIGSTKIIPETFQSQLINDSDISRIIKSDEKDGSKRLSNDDLNLNIKKRKVNFEKPITSTICTSTQIEEDISIVTDASSETLSQMFKRKTPDVEDNIPEKTKKQKVLNPFTEVIDNTISSKNISISSTLNTEPLKPSLDSSKTLTIRNPFAKAIKEEPQTSKTIDKNTEIDGNNPIKVENCSLDQYQKEFLWRTITDNDEGGIKMSPKDSVLTELMESFKNCVVIKKTPLVMRDRSVLGNISYDESGKPNFKRFKKANPVHTQTAVIKNFKTFVCCVDT